MSDIRIETINYKRGKNNNGDDNKDKQHKKLGMFQ